MDQCWKGSPTFLGACEFGCCMSTPFDSHLPNVKDLASKRNMTRTKPSSIFCTGLALPYRHVAEKLQTSKFRPTEKFENLLHLQFIFWKPITWIFLSLHFAGYFVTRAARMNCPEDFKPESCAYDRQVFPFVSIQHLVF